MNKLFRNIFTVLISALFSATVLTGCDGMMASVEDDSSSTSAMGYLSLSSLSGAIESSAADIRSAAREATTTKDIEGESTITSPDELTKVSVEKVVLKSNSTVEKYQTLKTWISDSDATETSGNAILKMHADTSIAIPVGDDGTATYTFYIELYDADGFLLGDGEEENVTVTSGVFTALNFEVTLYGDGAIKIKNTFAADAGVSKIEAGIFNSDDTAVSISDTETLDYEELAIFTSDDKTTQYAYYVAPEVAAGSYVYKVRVYGKQYSMGEDAEGNETLIATDVVINSYSYGIQIAEGLTTYKNNMNLENINTIYKITYNLGGAAWTESASPSYSRNNYTTTILPLASSMYLNGYGFDGWYDNENYTGEKITKIAAEDSANAKDLTFWAKWEKIVLNFELVELHTSKAEDLEVVEVLKSNTTLVAEAKSDFDFDHYKWFVNNKYYPEYDDQQVASIYIQFFDGGIYDVTVHASKEGTSKDSSAQVKFKVVQLPDFPITYMNGKYLDFETGAFTGTHESTYAPVFYYGGTTVLDAPTMKYYDFGGYYITSALDEAENAADAEEISVIQGEEYEDEITLYAKWNPKNPLDVTIPESSVQNFASLSADKDLKAGSSIYVLGKFEGTETEQWYTYQFFSKAEDNLSATLRSDLHRTGENYYSFYPTSAIASNIDAKSTATTITLNYADQKQTDTTNTLATHDFMTGKIVGTDLDSKLDFARLGEKLTFNIEGVPTYKTFKKMVLYVPDVYIPSKGKVDMTADTPVFECTETIPSDNYNHFTMDLDLTSSDGTLAVSVMLPPFDASGKTVIMTLIDSDGNYYNAYFDGENYEAGTNYAHDADADLKALAHYVTIGGKKVSTYNYGAYSPEDYGELYSYLKKCDLSLPSKADWVAIAENGDITATATTVHGVNGIKFTATDGTELFVPANGYSNSDGIVRNNEVNLWTNTDTGTKDTYVIYPDYTYILYGSSEEGENGVMAYGNSLSFSYGARQFY